MAAAREVPRAKEPRLGCRSRPISDSAQQRLIRAIPLSGSEHRPLRQGSPLPRVEEYTPTRNAAFDLDPAQGKCLQRGRALRAGKRREASWPLQQGECLQDDALFRSEEADCPLEVLATQPGTGAAGADSRRDAGARAHVELSRAARAVHSDHRAV